MPKCTHCSAPLPKSGIICEYCGKRNNIDLTSDYKFTNLRPHLKRTCPVCHTKMKTINIGKKLHLFIERCDSCFGIFFDSNELEAMIEYSVKGSRNVDLVKLAKISDNPRYVDILTYRKCPVCQKHMQRKNFMRRSGVITDICTEHGIWLDPGELRHIMEWLKVGGETKVQNSKEDLDTQVTHTYKKRKTTTNSSSSEVEGDIFEILNDFFTSPWSRF